MAGSRVTGFGAVAKAGAADSKKYERSTIKFPYGDLDDAIEVATAIHQNAGTSCTTDQLAGYLKQSASSGAFRLKVTTAAAFGLTENAGSSLTLTELARQIVDPHQAARAKAAAFINVELYAAIYDKYKGHLMPPPAALEREMLALGVAKKQTDRARQAFERSASQAGFYAHGKDRLVMPAALPTPPTKKIEERAGDKPPPGGGGDGGGDLHPFIQGLLQSLPAPGTDWEVEDQANWLKTAAQIFGMIYKSAVPVTTRIKVKDDEET